MTDKMSIAIYAFHMHMLRPLSVDKILLPRYVEWSTKFSGLPFDIEMSISCLKYLNSVLPEFIKRPILVTACFKLCSKDSV